MLRAAARYEVPGGQKHGFWQGVRRAQPGASVRWVLPVEQLRAQAGVLGPRAARAADPAPWQPCPCCSCLAGVLYLSRHQCSHHLHAVTMCHAMSPIQSTVMPGIFGNTGGVSGNFSRPGAPTHECHDGQAWCTVICRSGAGCRLSVSTLPLRRQHSDGAIHT